MGRERLLRCSILLLVGLVGTGALGRLDAQVGNGGVVGSEQAALVAAADGGRIEFAASRTSDPIVIDGRLDDAGWANAVEIPLPWEVNPAENERARVHTTCMLTHDADRLYLGCVAEDPDPSSIRAYVVDRDGIDGHDRVVLTLDPFNDQRRAFQFGISALGVQYDAVMAQQGAGNPNEGPDAQPVDPSWDAIWSSAGQITDDGYVVEASIPFRSLRFPEQSVDGWGAFVTRWWPRRANVEFRSAAWDRDNSCLLCQANLVFGIDGGTTGANVQLTPTITGGRTDLRSNGLDQPFVTGDLTRELGVDGQWGITSDLTLNVTGNPDFSQVEADVAQIDVNNRFALFFPERRPFFMEGADFFGTPVQAVFTRSIVSPRGGAKLTGKLGANAVGVLVAEDRSNGLLIPGTQFSRAAEAPGRALTSIARFRRDVGSTSTIGALFVGREGDDYYNRVAGFDAFYRPLPSLTIQGQLLRSTTAYPQSIVDGYDQPDGAFQGNAGAFNARWTTRNWLVNADLRQTDADFRADAGFLTMAGVRGGNANLTRRWWGGSDQWFTQLRAVIGTWRNQDFEGNQLNGGMWVGLMYDGPGQLSVGLWPNLFMREFFAGETYDGLNQLFFDVRAAPSGTWSAGLNGNVGDAIDFANARLGFERRFAPEVSVRLGRNTEAGLQHTWQTLTFGGERVFAANLSQLRAVYNFSPRSYVRAIVQYRRTTRNPALYDSPVDRQSEGLFGQLLYAYKLNPQTVFFLGYAQDGTGLEDATRVRTPLTVRGRTLFVKLGYAWRP
ncbi:MAG: DUF5916 domain-containing protein [Gemmatimonadota bacterium]